MVTVLIRWRPLNLNICPYLGAHTPGVAADAFASRPKGLDG